MSPGQEMDNRLDQAIERRDSLQRITPEMDRRNSWLFFVSWLLTYFAAPVVYIDVVQAALCDKLGASVTIANLPASAYLLGNFAPIFAAWLIPLRLERFAMVWTNAIGSVLLALVSVALILPLGNSIQIAVVIGYSFLYGMVGSISGVYIYQCLGRGTSSEGRAKALKMTFTFGPIAAVAGSLGTQFVLNQGIPFLNYPYDFAFLYFLGVPCLAAVAWLSCRYDLPPAEERPSQSLCRYLAGSTKAYWGVRPLVFLWFGFLLWYFTLNAISNLSLYAKEAIGRDPKELSGLINALRFGFKCLAGWGLGWVALRRGVRTPVALTVILVGMAILWTWTMPGYLYLLAFGMMGAGELGGAYFLNYGLALSSPATGARNLAILSLTTPASSLAPALHGALTDQFGFRASLVFALATAIAALWLVLRLPSKPEPERT